MIVQHNFVLKSTEFTMEGIQQNTFFAPFVHYPSSVSIFSVDPLANYMALRQLSSVEFHTQTNKKKEEENCVTVRYGPSPLLRSASYIWRSSHVKNATTIALYT